MSAITSFLSGTGTDHRHRKIGDILAFDDQQLEHIHDYIQWLFPLPERSAFNALAPILTVEDIDRLRMNAAAHENIRAAAERMLSFYRLTANWLTARDHNHLRISRIIRSIALTIGRDDAAWFHDEIMKLVEAAGNPVSEESLAYWREANNTRSAARGKI
jgi:hypothetical protein